MNIYSIKKILVPVDLSDTSLNALETAVLLAKKNNATIQLLHVCENIFGLQNDELHQLFSRNKNENVFNALMASIEHTHKLKPQLIQKRGHPVDSVIFTAISEQIDLIVIGTHGASGLRENFVGTNTYNVIKYSTCPVLTVPPGKKISSFKRVLFPIRPITGALMPYDIASHFLSVNSTLEVLGLSQIRRETELRVLDKITEEIKDKLIADKVRVKLSWGRGISISDDILQFAQATNPDLIILTSILDTIAKPNFIGPYSQKLINQATVPLLSIKKLGVPVFV